MIATLDKKSLLLVPFVKSLLPLKMLTLLQQGSHADGIEKEELTP